MGHSFLFVVLLICFVNCYSWSSIFSQNEDEERKPLSFVFQTESFAGGYKDTLRKAFIKRGYVERKQEEEEKSFTQDLIWGQCTWLDEDWMVRSMNDYSRCSNMPNIHYLTLKTYLHWVIFNTRKLAPSLFRHWPEGFNLEHASEYKELKDKFIEHEKQKETDPNVDPLVYIVKNPFKNAGSGIQLINSSKSLDIIFQEGGLFHPMNQTKPLAQKYVTNPLLIVGHKTTFRVWVLITSFDPITIYRYDNGPVKFAGRKYQMNNFEDNNIHVASWAPELIDDLDTVTLVNKLNLVGGRTDYNTIKPTLEEMNFNLTQISEDIDSLILSTVFAADKHIHPAFMRYLVIGREYRLRPFELLGLDILLDTNGKPHLLEINMLPDLRSETPILSKLVTQLLEEMFDLVDIDNKHVAEVRRITEETWKIVSIIKSVEGVPFNFHQIKNKDEWYTFINNDIEFKRSKKTQWRRLVPNVDVKTQILSLSRNDRNKLFAHWHNYNLSYTIIESLLGKNIGYRKMDL